MHRCAVDNNREASRRLGEVRYMKLAANPRDRLAVPGAGYTTCSGTTGGSTKLRQRFVPGRSPSCEWLTVLGCSISKVPKRLRDCEAPRRSRALASARNRGPTEYDRAGDCNRPHSDYIARGFSFALVDACERKGRRDLAPDAKEERGSHYASVLDIEYPA